MEGGLMRHAWRSARKTPTGRHKGLRWCRRCGLGLLPLVYGGYLVLGVGLPREAKYVPVCEVR